jgi:hypothetical protein
MSGNCTLTFTINSGKWKSLTEGKLMKTPQDVSIGTPQLSGGADVTVDAQGNVSVTGGLDALSVQMSDSSYATVALVFKETDGNSSDPSGATAFGPYTRGLTGGKPTLTVRDDGSSGSAYEFYVLIQSAGGDFGLIDPKITNQ